jgi:hypothetical protein
MTTITRIDRTTNACVRNALEGPKTPLAALATTLYELRNDPTWSPRDVRQVQVRAFRRLIRREQSYAQLEQAKGNEPE